ncbi:PP2C family protein-serine/threonine phosphatase [Nocardia sp. NPDC050406]|uniref:PP2C family protein-serine/threonine phosphatase n=1 Tax=Nocardia sp. NPDC050406 TaxID=3364318 RepID=UPI0037BCE91C
MTDLEITAAAGSEIGRRYRANFDVVHLSEHPLLAVVADGMGDGEGSAMAGRTTVDIVVERLARNADKSAIREAVAVAQRRVGEFGRRIGELAGCTLTVLAQAPDGLWLGQIGDSRLYRLRGGLLELLTVDHTMAWLGAVHGWYPFDSPEAAAARYRLTRYVGHPEQPEPDVVHIHPQAGDIYLLCTDGVAEQVSYQRMLEILGQGGSPRRKVKELLAQADNAGGRDNATAIVVEFAG